MAGIMMATSQIVWALRRRAGESCNREGFSQGSPPARFVLTGRGRECGAEGVEFKAHRVALASCSGYFLNLFESGMRDAADATHALEGISPAVLKAVCWPLSTRASVRLTRAC